VFCKCSTVFRSVLSSSHQSIRLRVSAATIFVLLVLVGTAPAQQRGSFPDYQRCVEAGIGQVDTLQQIERVSVRWECIPQDW
jgi:hypothetical protein